MRKTKRSISNFLITNSSASFVFTGSWKTIENYTHNMVSLKVHKQYYQFTAQPYHSHTLTCGQKHAHKHTLSHALCSSICCFHTAMFQKCKHSFEEGGVVQACVYCRVKVWGWSVCLSQLPSPWRGEWGLLKCHRSLKTRLDGPHCGKNPWAVCDPKPPLTSLCFSPHPSLIWTTHSVM